MNDSTSAADDGALPWGYWNYPLRRSKPAIDEQPQTLHLIDAPLEASGIPLRVACKVLPDGAISHRLLGRAVIFGEMIRSVGIADLGRVTLQCSNRVFDSISHHTRFQGGGEVSVTYSAQGKLLELVASNVTMTITQDNQVSFQPLSQD
jgi:hypothetical protein